MPAPDSLRKTYQDAPDSVLLEAIANGAEAYSPEAWAIIVEEIASRGLAEDQVATPSTGPDLPASPQELPEFITFLAISAGFAGLALRR